MKKRERSAEDIRRELLERYPVLSGCEKDILAACAAIEKCFRNDCKLMVAGNGGSAADSEHIVGELMKSFLLNRSIRQEVKEKLTALSPDDGAALADKLEGALPAIPLTSMPALTTAFANDVDAAVDYAQKLYGYGRAGDVFLGISTSGNARNILYAMLTARAMGIQTILLTGGDGGMCRTAADIVICVPETETFKIQELHLPVYHAICAMLEAKLF